jgi:predicted kinase
VSAELVITRGLPGSGKTTFAREWVAEDRANRVRVNRDDLRNMFDDGVYHNGITEKRVVKARNALIRNFLGWGLDVICDDTNLPPRVVSDLRELASRCGATLEIKDLTQVPLEECLARNNARGDKLPVPEEWIRSQHAQYISPETGTILTPVV